MPKKSKKVPRNAYYYFMQDFRTEQQKNGIQYESLAEVATAADPAWRNASPQERAKYEAIAKKVKEKHHIEPQKLTSTGIPVSEVQQQEDYARAAIQNEKEDIENMVKIMALNKTLLDEDFYVIDVNYYCKTSTKYVIAESTVLRFNIRNGYRDFYHELLNPGFIPVGYASDAKEGCLEFGLDMPDENGKKSNTMQILANIIDYLRHDERKAKTIPPLFTMPEKVIPVQDFLWQMCEKTGEREEVFRVYKLDTLFFHLKNTLKTSEKDGLPRESLALVQLKKDPFKYNANLGCEHHEANDKSVECTTSRTKRWTFTILDGCCASVGVKMIAGQHLPEEYDVEAILKFKDGKKKSAEPALSDVAGPSSSCNTSVSESQHERSLNSTASSLQEHLRKEKKRTHAPLRMPQADYSRNICPAPDLPDMVNDFPALSINTGRGRGLAAGYGKSFRK